MLLPALRSGSRWRVQQIVSGGADPEDDPGQDCREDGPLLFSVDRHGWAEPSRPLSGRALTGIYAVRLSQVDHPRPGPGVERVRQEATGSGIADPGWDDLFDRLDALTDELDTRARELLAEARSQAEWVKAARTPAGQGATTPGS